ncbi:MAG TPA: DUF5694 domain-containing protein [Fimbriimonadaceae bacterium]|nr:DUF5694 domain-containing protein [Fimbriimonadaceae bacterium]
MFNCLVFLSMSSGLAAPPPEQPVVMVLGTYHMNNPGMDAVKVTQRDTLGADRQKEIAELLSRLAKFKPTKILVEAEPARQAVLDQRFKDFLAGKHELLASEVEQVGFRLAKTFALSGLTGVDYKSDMDFGKVLNFAAQNGMSEFAQRVGRLFEEVGKLMTELDRKHTVSELLAFHNDPELSRQGHSLYLDFLAVGKGDQHPGADLVAGWYRRNMVIAERIRANLAPGDRALVIYGSGHAYLLNHFLRDCGRVSVEEAKKYLPRPPRVSWPKLNSAMP